MAQARDRQLLDWLRSRQSQMEALLEELARAESPTLESETQRRPFTILAAELEQAGMAVRPIRGREHGDALYARPAGRRHGASFQLLLGHMDTVWPVGTLESMPLHVEDGRLYGPGVYDMKGGLVEIVFALRGLRALDLPPELTPVVLVNADEELGSSESGPIIRRLAAGASRAFVLEPSYGPSGRLKTGRKGAGRFELTIRGRAAHAGSEPEAGVSAILELSHQIQHLFALNEPERGITVNVGTIDGGLGPNVVAPEAKALIDVRIATAQDADRIEREIHGLEPVQDGVELEISGRIGRPPMEATPRNRELFRLAERLAGDLGITVDEATIVGGASDANSTSRYTATLDGLGPVGDGSHAPDEHVLLASMPERAALLGLLLLAPDVGTADLPLAS